MRGVNGKMEKVELGVSTLRRIMAAS